MNARSTRPGYAMILVLVFIGLVNLCLVLSFKHLDGAIRVGNAHRVAQETDEGSALALAAGLAMLEKDLPTSDPLYANGYSYGVTVGDHQFQVTYTPPDPILPSEPQTWTVTVERRQYPNDTLRDLPNEYPDTPAG